MKRPDDLPAAELLEADIELRRDRLAANLDELSARLRPANLLAELQELAWKRVDRMTDELMGIAEDLLHDTTEFLRDHRLGVAGTALTALAAGGLIWWATQRRQTVPLYAAYDREDPDMMDDDEHLAGKATQAWDKVKSEARHLGDKASETYYAARSKANELADEARERAAHAADVARERALEAADAARDAAEKAREAAGEAGRWARRQPAEHPATVVLVALAAGVLIGALLPSGRNSRA
ncbi:MAG: DUF3618 domain-containing protein [Sphingomonadaceae bacterium]